MRFFASPKPALFLVMAAFLLLAQPAAAAVNKKGQQKLEKIFETLLTQYQNAARNNNATLESEGRIMVEPNDFYYAVTLPHLTLRKQDGTYTEIGMLAINVMPGETDDTWKMTVAIPTPVVYYDKAGSPVMTIEMGSQNFAGIWNEQFNNFTHMQAEYQNIRITGNREQAQILIPSVSLASSLTADENNLWSGPTDIRLSGLQISAEADKSAVQIGEIAIHSTVTDYDPAALSTYQEQLDALSENYVPGSENVSGEHVVGLYNMLFGFLGSGFDGFDFNASLKDMAITRPPLEGAPASTIRVDDAGFGFGIKGFRSGTVDTTVKAAFNGSALKPQVGDITATVPSHLNLDLAIENLPYNEIVALGRETLQISMQEAPNAAQSASQRFVGMIPELLTKAQTTLTLKDTALGNDQYNIRADGALTTDMQAALGVTGNVKASITGLESLITAMQQAASDPKIADAQQTQIQQTLSGLAIVQMIGQMDKNAQGQTVRTYDLSIDKQGQAVLNGTNLQMLLQNMPGQSKQP